MNEESIDLTRERTRSETSLVPRASDQEIARDFLHVLGRVTDLDTSQIEFEVRDNEITLRGRVLYREDKQRVEDLAEAIPEVHRVFNYLRSFGDLSYHSSHTKKLADRICANPLSGWNI